MLLWSVAVFLSTTVAGFMFNEKVGASPPVWLTKLNISLGENPLSRGVIDPQTDVYLRVGSELSLNCTLTGYQTPVNASYLYFTRKPEDKIIHELIPKENLQILGPRKIGLKIPNVQLSDSGWYYCALDESSVERRTNSTPINQISVTVSEPPQPITNITCISDNYEDMTCDWCDQVQPGVRYELHWRIGSTGSFYKCSEPMRHQSICKCYFPGAGYRGSVSTGDLFHLGVTYNMVVVSLCPPTICHGSNVSSRQFLINTLDIVKPRPPNQLHVNVTSSTTLAVRWQPPPGLENSRIYPLVYAVSYTSSRNTSVMESEVVFNETSLNLTNLHPYTEYNIGVAAKPSMDGGYYSDQTSCIVRTGESEPSAPPLFLSGSFRLVEQKNGKRKVIIFFGEIPQYEVNGLLTGFTIKYRPLQDDTADEITVFSPNNKYTKELLLDSQSTYRVSVAGRTIGDGVSSSIYIPWSENVIAPKDIEGIVGENGTFVKFVVIPPDGAIVDNYTLVYCPGQMINGISEEKDCKAGSIPVAQTYPGNSEQILFYSHQADFVYGIAVNYNINTTSGLSPTWLCLYDYNGEPSPPIVSYPQVQNEGSLTMEWVRPRCSQEVRGRVSRYELKVYLEQVLVHNVSIDAGFNEKLMYTIPNLQPYTSYNIVLTACTLAKCSLAYNESQLSPESEPGGPPLNVHADYHGDEMTLTWQPPALPNGIITHYNIEITNLNSSGAIYKEVHSEDNSTMIAIPDLPGYTNYSVQIQAVNSAGTSVLSEPVMVWGPIKAPGHIELEATLLDQSNIRVNLSPPQPPNGPHPQYLLITSYGNIERNYTFTEERYTLKLDCSQYKGMFNISALAVNTLENGTKLEGPASNVKSLIPCSEKSGNWKVILFVVLAAAPVILLIVVIILWRKHIFCKSGESTKVIMPQEIHETEELLVEPDHYVTIDVDNQASGYSKPNVDSMQLDDDVDHDSGVGNPQGSYKSQQGSLDSEERDSDQIMVSSEDDQNSTDIPVTLVEHQPSNQSVESGRIIDTYTKATGTKSALYHEINDSEPSQLVPSEKDCELPHKMDDGGETPSNIETSTDDSAEDLKVVVTQCRLDGISGYQHGNAREEDIQFEIPQGLDHNSSTLTESTNSCDQVSVSSSFDVSEIHLQVDGDATHC